MPEPRHGNSTWVDLQQASDLLYGLVNAHTLARWVREGRVPGAIRVGRRIYLRRRSVGDLMVSVEDEIARARAFPGEPEPTPRLVSEQAS